MLAELWPSLREIVSMSTPALISAEACVCRRANRFRHAERELDRFRSYADLADPHQERTFLKLGPDIVAAQRDAAWFQHQLDAACQSKG